jgi:hypothetical protein
MFVSACVNQRAKRGSLAAMPRAIAMRVIESADIACAEPVAIAPAVARRSGDNCGPRIADSA